MSRGSFLCYAWDAPADGFKAAVLIAENNKMKNKFFQYCRDRHCQRVPSRRVRR
jgi:hypothetical protein